jgi:flagellar hook-associated protein 3 FlgL
MRISTVGFQYDALTQMQALESAMSKTQSELSTGKQIQTAADNPTGMAEVNELNVQLSASQQYVTNGNAASANLQLEEQALTQATNVLQSAQDLAVQANNSGLSAGERQNIAAQLQQQLQELVGIGNSTDSNGNYLFGGYASGAQPFAQSGNSVAYSGADSVSQVQISSDQRISGGDTGAAVFMNIPAGNGTFTTAAGPANTGSASIDAGSVTNPATWVPDTYTISFTSPTQYQVTDGGGALVASGTYTSGDAIAFNGVQATVSGTPASGDKFTVSPASTASAFSTLSNLITTLTSTTLNQGQTTTQINSALEQLGGAITSLDNVQASVGARINSITAAQTTAQSQQTNLQSSISNLSDVDYAAAVTQLNTEEVGLQAAQESYASLAKLSLFNYLT